MTNEGNLSKRSLNLGNQVTKFPNLINEYEIRIKLNHFHTKNSVNNYLYTIYNNNIF